MGRSYLNHTLTDEELNARLARLQRKRRNHVLNAAAFTSLTVLTAFLFVPLVVAGAHVIAADKINKKAHKCKKEMKQRTGSNQSKSVKLISKTAETYNLESGQRILTIDDKDANYSIDDSGNARLPPNTMLEELVRQIQSDVLVFDQYDLELRNDPIPTYILCV